MDPLVTAGRMSLLKAFLLFLKSRGINPKIDHPFKGNRPAR